MTIFCGLNVLESKDLSFEVAEKISFECNKAGISLVFKASFDKANRSSLQSFRGPGINDGLRWLFDIKDKFQLTVMTDVHESGQVSACAEVVDILQLPAFLSRQTDLVASLAKTRRVINIKKAQFLSPLEMKNIIDKFVQYGNDQIILCERGSCFGYQNLVVDMLGLGVMKEFGFPVILDVSHSLQLPGGNINSSGGRREQICEFSRAGVAVGLAGIFLEVHPNPDEALCDGRCALPLDKLGAFLDQVMKVDNLVKRLPPLEIK